jgi:hypothetical protein
MRQISEVAIIVKTQSQDFKIYSFNIKVLSQGTCIWNTKAISLTIQKMWPNLKILLIDWLYTVLRPAQEFFIYMETFLKILKSGLNIKVNVTRSKIMVPLECSCHKEHTYEIPITYHSKDMANVKVFQK